MKNISLISSIFFLLLFLFGQAYGGNCNNDSIFLQYDGIDTPPHCFIPHRLLYQPKIGLALSGGGARGLAQIGVLKVLEENNIPINFIVGVSMGAVIGGLYASGYTPKQLEQIVKEINWNEIIIDTPPRSRLFIVQKEERERPILQIRFKGLKPVFPEAITVGQKLSSVLADITMRVAYQISSNFDSLKIPFRALTCDLISGQKVLLNEGDLAEAMRASSTFPLLFSPVPKDSMLLVDGGLINNIPVDEVRESGVDLVIAVDTSSKLHEKNRLKAPWIIADQVTTIMQREKKAEQREKADVLIQLDMEYFKSDNFQFIDSLIIEGEEKANEKVALIKNLLEQQQRKNFPDDKFQINHLNIIGCSSENKQQISDHIFQIIKEEVTFYEIYTTLEKIYRLSIFSDIFAEISDDSLIFHITENPSFTQISITGNTIFSDSLICSVVSSHPSETIHYLQSKQDLENILELYRNNGYSLAQIRDVKIQNDTLTIQIDEGMISDIQLQGNQRTKDYIIFREFPLRKGDIFNINLATEGINNIHSTDLFTNVSFEIKRISNSVQVIIKLLEKPFSVIRLSARYDFERKGKGFIEIADKNILGSGNNITLHGQYGPRNQLLNLQFRADRIFKTYLTYQLDLYYNSFKDYTYSSGARIGEYQNFNKGFSFSIGQQIKRLGMLSLMTRLKSIDYKELYGDGYPTGKLELKTIAIQSFVDMRDKYPFPTKGKYYKFFYEVSSANFLNSQVSFFKIYSSLEAYFTFQKRNTIHPKVSWGASDMTTPFSEQFRLGGLTSFYGLNENENVGRYLFSSSLEYRYRFPFRTMFDFYWSIRYDVGTVWKNQIDIKPADIDHGIGTSLSMNTFLGPITIAYGWHSRGKKLAYVSAGYEF